MLDIRTIRDNLDKVKKAMKARNKDIDLDALVALDKLKRDIVYQADLMKAKQNQVSKQIPQFKKEGKDTAGIFAEMKQLSDDIKQSDVKIRELDEKILQLLYDIPNIPADDVPIGKDSSDNVEIRNDVYKRQVCFLA